MNILKEHMDWLKQRPQRLRRSAGIRDLVRETRLCADNLVMPFFVVKGKNVRQAIPSLQGQFRLSKELLIDELALCARDGVRTILLFGIPEKKDEAASGAFEPNGVVQDAVKAIKDKLPDITVITDVCLCQYTSHGHCGVLVKGKGEKVEIDTAATLDLLSKTAVSHVRAGADIVAPSAMTDGQVGALRQGLDNDGFSDVPIMAYSVKYASSFYGPFREAAGSTPAFGDRSSYQLDTANAGEALREAALDVAEGADIVMVKPALAYMDVIRRISERSSVPVAAYNVSGEYAMVKAASAAGLIDEKKTVAEILTGIRRAGASIIISYHARDAAGWMAEIGNHK
jgi:porphobilinogen synthase